MKVKITAEAQAHEESEFGDAVVAMNFGNDVLRIHYPPTYDGRPGIIEVGKRYRVKLQIEEIE